MSRSRWNHSLLPALMVVLLLAGSALALEEGAKEWSQEEVSLLATQFEGAVSDLYAKVRVDQIDPAQTKSAEGYLLAEDLKSLKRHAARLSKALSEGSDREGTGPLFDRMLSIVLRLRQLAPRVPFLTSHVADIERARGVLDQLAPYYGRTLPPPVTAPGSPN